MDNFVQWNYENANTANFLVYTLGENENFDTVALGMLLNNNIEGFLPMIYLQNDEERYFKYNITSKVSLKMFFEETVNKTRFLNVISSICKAFEMCGEYMIEDKSIVLDAEHIFVDVSSAKAELVCLPVLKEGGANVNVVNFFKLLLMSTQFDPTENCDYIAKLLNSLNKSDKMSFAEIRNIAEELLGNVQEEEDKPVMNAMSAPQTVSAAALITPIAPMQNVQNVQSAPNIQNIQRTQVQNMQRPNTPNIPNIPNIPNVPNQPNQPQNVPPVINDNSKSSHKGGLFGGLMKSGKKSKEKKPKKGKEAVQAAPQMAIPGVKASAGPLMPNYPQPAQNVAPMANNQPMHSIPAQQMNVQPGITFQQSAPKAAPQQAMTTVLNKDMLSANCTPKLYRYKTNELIEINKVPFRVGKEASFVDYCISDNTAVSRSHANIVKRGNDYFIVDTNSTNHTYVNGAMIQSNDEIKLEENTRIKFANEEFEFRFF